MTRPVRCAIVGYGAIAESHGAALVAGGATIRAAVGPNREAAAAFASRHHIPGVFTHLESVLGSADIDAVVIASPSAVHAQQAVAALQARKHVLCEIPVGLSLEEAESVSLSARMTGCIAMVCHTQRYWAPVVAVMDLITQRRFTTRHVVARTAMRRHENIGWTGRKRSWVDNLLWHHGCHAVDTTMMLTGGAPRAVFAAIAPPLARTGLPMDIDIVLCGQAGAVASISLSYNSMIGTNDYLVIGEEDTLLIDRGRLVARDGSVIAGGDPDEMQDDAVVRQDAEFLSAVQGGRAPSASVDSVLPAMRVLQEVQQQQQRQAEPTQ